MTLDAISQQQIIDLLLPFMPSEQERSTLFLLAFGPGHPLLGHLDFSGPPQAAITHLIQRTLAYGESQPGVPALWALLEVIRQQVGLDKQVQIDRFRTLLGLPPRALPDHVFVSYSRQDETFARRIELDLQDAGLKVWFDRFKLRGGDEWRSSIERGIERSDFVVFCLSPASATSDSCYGELNMARERGKLIIPVMIIDCLHLLGDPSTQSIAWLKDRHILDFTRDEEYGRHFKELLAALPGYNPPDSYYEDTLDARQIPNPFRGLEAFRELDYHYFAGRETAIAELVQRLHDETKPRLLAVVGASGSGKSSLVRAGLLPMLRDVPNVQWETAVFKPGHQPLRSLAERLELRFGQPATELREMFLQRPTSLSESVQVALSGPRGETRFLLVVDQCEEVFASAADGERQLFFDLLYAAVTAPESAVHVLLTMRADFFSYLTTYPDLAALVEDNLFITTEMSVEQLRRCIETPAQKVGLVYEQGLVEQILEAVREQPGTLPLLQYTLKELYERRSGRKLTQQAYLEIGGVQGALATRAETIYSDLNASQKDVIRRLMLQLVEVGDESVTRRRVSLSALQLQGIMSVDLRAVVDSLTAEHARLLVASAPISDDDPDNDAEINLEISHEALLTHWQRLAGWIDENRNDLRRGGEYLQLAQAWQTAEGQDTSYLLTGARLVVARDWLTRADATRLQREFIDASADHEAQEVARLESLTAEAERAVTRANAATQQAQDANHKAETASKHAIRNRQIALITGMGAGIIALLATLISTQGISQAQQREDQAVTAVAAANATLAPIPVTLTFTSEQVKKGEDRIESLRLAALASEELLKDNPYTATLLALQALQISWTSQADFVLGRALKDNHAVRQFAGHQAAISFVAYSTEGHFILTTSDDGTMTVWDAQTGKPLRTFQKEQELLLYLASSQDGHLVATTGFDITADVWNVVTGEHLLTLNRGTDQFLRAAFSPKGDFIATSSRNEVIVWNAQTGEQSLTLQKGEIDALTYSPNGTEILMGQGDGTVIVWDLETEQIVHTSKAHQGPIWEVSYSPDGRFYVTVSRDTTLLWDAETDDIKQTLPGLMPVGNRFPDLPLAIWSPDSRLIAGAIDKTVLLWNVETGQVIYTLQDSDTLSTIVYSPDGHHILTATVKGAATVWDTSTGQPVSHLQGHTKFISAATYSSDGQFIVTGSEDATAILWNADMNDAFRLLPGHTDAVNSIAYSPDGRFAVTGSRDMTAILWDMVTRTRVHTLIGHSSRIVMVAYSPDGRMIATGSDDGAVILWDAATGEAVQHLKYEAIAINALSFSSDSRYLMTSDRQNAPVTIWDVTTGQAVQTFSRDEHNGTISSAVISPDGRFAATGSSDYTARLWDIATGKSIHILKKHTYDVSALAYSPDGRFLVTGSFDNTAVVWDTATGEPLHTLPMTAYVMRVAYSHDGNTILTGDQNGAVFVWDAKTGEKLHSLMGHAVSIVALGYTFEDRSIITSSEDGITLVWSATTGELHHTIQGQAGAAIAYSPDGSQVIQGNGDGSIMIWDATPEHVLDAACRQIRALRGFTEEERMRFRIQDDVVICP